MRKESPDSFATIATKGSEKDLIAFLLSLSFHHPDTDLILLCDSHCEEVVKNLTPDLPLNIDLHVTLDEYSGKNRKTMEKDGTWSDFQMKKAEAIRIALSKFANVIFLDSDIFLFSSIEVDVTKQLGVSPHMINPDMEKAVGRFNGGCLWTNNKNLPDDWIEATKDSRYFDQAAIEDLVGKYDYFEFDETYNVSWWRLFQSEEPVLRVASRFSIEGGTICINGKPIKFVHTHFNVNDVKYDAFNNFIISLLVEAGRYREILALMRARDGHWTITLPEQPAEGKFFHKDDSFRELAQILAEKNKDVRTERQKTGNCWLGPVLLYDRPTPDWIGDLEMGAMKGLIGNGFIYQYKKLIKGAQPWIFWARHPRLLEKNVWDGGSSERRYESVFIGNVENPVQGQNRDDNWSSVIEFFHLTRSSEHKFSPEEYFGYLLNSDFGLDLPGFGPKCHRFVELIACGCIPLVHVECSLDFQEKLYEGENFFYVESPTQARQIMSSLSSVDKEAIRLRNLDYYYRNFHSDHAWNTMMNHLLFNLLP